MNRPLKSALLGLSVLVAALLLATIAGLYLGGAALDQGFADPGDVIRFGLPVAKSLMNLSIGITVGCLVFAAFALGNSSLRLRRLLSFVAVSSAAWVIIGVVHFVFSYLSVSGATFSVGQSFSSGLWLYATQISLGQSLALNLIAALVISSFALGITRLIPTAFLAALSLASLIPLALIGHAAGSANHALAVNSLGLHLVGISIWVGGLVALFVLREEELTELASRYSTLALWGFGLVATSGITGALIRLARPEDLFGPYGQIVLVKAMLIVALGVLGVVYRTRILRKQSLSGLFWKLALAELALMGAALGLGAALARTAPPVAEEISSNPTPAELLTGEPLPPPWGFDTFLTQFKPDVLWLTIAAVAIIAYLQGVRRLALRGDRWPLGRSISWVAGMLLLAFVTSGSLNAYQPYLFSVHMIAHMALTMAVPVLLVPGAPVTLLMRAAKKRNDDSMGVREWVLWAVHTPLARFISHPIFAAVNFAASLVIFYFTPIFSWATREHLGHEWMVLHFLITGYLFVQALIGIDPGPTRLGYPMRLLMLIATMAFHAFFGLALMGGSGLLLADWFGAMGRTWGDDPLTDQQTGGAIAWGVGEIPTIALTIMVSIQWYRADRRESTRLDRASDRSGGTDLDAYNEMLSKLGRKP